MIDRIVHHADVHTKGTSSRLRGRGIDNLPSTKTQDQTDWRHQPVAAFFPVALAQIRALSTRRIDGQDNGSDRTDYDADQEIVREKG
jgi:hypothetical protein